MRSSTAFSCLLLALLLIALGPQSSQAAGIAILIPGSTNNAWTGSCETDACTYANPCGIKDDSYTISVDPGESTCILEFVNGTDSIAPIITSTIADRTIFSFDSSSSFVFNPTINTNTPLYFRSSSTSSSAVFLNGDIKTIWTPSLGWVDGRPLITISNVTLSTFSLNIEASIINTGNMNPMSIDVLFDQTTFSGTLNSAIPALNISTDRWLSTGSPRVTVKYNNATFMGSNNSPALVGSDSTTSTRLEFQGGQGYISTNSLLTIPIAESVVADYGISLFFNGSKLQLGTTQLIKQVGAHGLTITTLNADLSFGPFGLPVYDATAAASQNALWNFNSTWSYIYGLDLSYAGYIGCLPCVLVNCKLSPLATNPVPTFEIGNLGTTSEIIFSNDFPPALPQTHAPLWNMQNMEVAFTHEAPNFGTGPPTLIFYSDLPAGESFIFREDVQLSTTTATNCTVIFDVEVVLTDGASLASACDVVFNEGVYAAPSATISGMVNPASEGQNAHYPSITLATHKPYNVSFNLESFAHLVVNFTSSDSLSTPALQTAVVITNMPRDEAAFHVTWPAASLGAPPGGQRIDILNITSVELQAYDFDVPTSPLDLGFVGSLVFSEGSTYTFFIRAPVVPTEPVLVMPPFSPPPSAPTFAPVSGSRCPSTIPAGFACVNGRLVSQGSVTIGTDSNTTSTFVVTTASVVIQGNLTVSNGSQIVFTNAAHLVEVQGCVELANGSFVLIDLSETKEADLPSGSHVLISQAGNCGTSLQTVPIQLKKPKNTCKKVSATKTNQQTASSLTVLFVTDSSPCNTKWIIVGAVLGGAVLIGIVATIVIYTVVKNKKYDRAKTGLRA